MKDAQPWKGLEEAMWIAVGIAVSVWGTLKMIEALTGWRGGWWE
ncbi:MAG: hypothetical protein BWY10_02564 [Chloroflexi bacterium ADurb.Bin180]|nr:MAG: hypothetical protein BWY10_02564 [Chloroflexi bacterium ADurb.Bin180]